MHTYIMEQQQEMQQMKSAEKLADRMINFDGFFDGYPSMTCFDEVLIQNAFVEVNECMPQHKDLIDAIPLMCFLASEHAKTEQQYTNCRKFIDAYIECAWDANMCEGDNQIHAKMEAKQ